MIVLGAKHPERLHQYFSKVEAKGYVGNRYAMADEHFTIYLCRQPKGGWTLEKVWPALKNWD